MPESGEQAGSSRGAVAALCVLAVLVLGGLWLTHVLSGAATVQDCVSAGRTNCAPIAISPP
jgi:hypothetical protein